MIDDKIKSNNISQHFDSFQEYLNNEVKAVVGGYIPSYYVKRNILFSKNDSVIDGIYLRDLSNEDKTLLFKPFEADDIILNNSENYGSLGLPCHIEDYKIVKSKDLVYKQSNLQNKKDKSFYARIYVDPKHKCIGDLIKNFYQYIFVEGTGYVWTDNQNIYKRQFMYERLKVNFHENCGDSYGILKSIMQALVDIKNNDITNSSELLNITDMLNSVIKTEQNLLK